MAGELAVQRAAGHASPWPAALARLALAAAALIAATFPAWRAMAHQWWDIDTYSHILLVPAIVLWLGWLRRGELARVAPRGWWPGVLAAVLALGLHALGVRAGINTIAQAGAVGAVQAAVLATLGLRAGLLLAFPLAYAAFLVPVGDEIIPPLQIVTAQMASALTRLSGIETVANGIAIGTPAGLFIVAEECAGVKFLIAMVAIGVLVAGTRLESWRRRALFLAACVVVPILANGLRAYATIAIAQRIGAEAATGFDHIVYGWVFFAIVVAAVLGLAWRWFEREPHEAGWRADEVAAMRWVARIDPRPAAAAPDTAAAPVLLALLASAIAFALVARLG